LEETPPVQLAMHEKSEEALFNRQFACSRLADYSQFTPAAKPSLFDPKRL